MRVKFKESIFDAIQFYHNFEDVHNFDAICGWIEDHYGAEYMLTYILHDYLDEDPFIELRMYPKELEPFYSKNFEYGYIIHPRDYLVSLPTGNLGIYDTDDFDIIFNKVC